MPPETSVIRNSVHRIAWATTALLAVSACGCLKSYRVEPDQFAQYWMLETDPTTPQTPARITLGGRKLPATWVIQQTADDAAAKVSQDQAITAIKLPDPPARMEMAVSVQQARALAETLGKLRGGIESLKPLMQEHTIKDPRAWADAMANALVEMEDLTRAAAGSGNDGLFDAPSDPILQMLVTSLNEHARGGLLSGLEGAEMDQLRHLLVQVMLRLGFAAAGKIDPPDVRRETAAMMKAAENPATLKRPLATMLAERFSKAPPAPPGNQLPDLVEIGFHAVPKVLQAVEILARQWDAVREVSATTHEVSGEKAVVMTFDILPGREVRLDDMLPLDLQPALVTTGRVRMTVLPHLAPTRETVVLFEPDPAGSMQLQFRGPIYAMVRALVLPLASGDLREIRVFTKRSASGTSLINVRLAMLDTSAKGDRRRLLVVQDVHEQQIVRTLESVRPVTLRRDLVVNYLTPERRYVYIRQTTGGN